MPSRRNALEVGGAVAATALAGCLGGVPATDGGSDPRLTATRVELAAVPSGAVVAPATDGLLATVRKAARFDGHVDFVPEGGADHGETLVLGQFQYLRFRGETYDPYTEFVPFAGEPSNHNSTDGASHGDSGPHHVLRLDPTDPGPDATVVTVADRAVPAGVEDVVLSAVEEESVALDGDERDVLASFLDGVGYVATVDAVAGVELHGAGG